MSQHVLRIGGREYKAEVKELTPERATVFVDEKEYVVDLVQLGRRQVTGDAVRSAVTPVAGPAPAPVPPPAPVAPPPAPAAVSAPAPVAPAPVSAPRPSPSKTAEGGIVAPMPGLVLSIKVKEGETVTAGQLLLLMEAMKMENAITSPYSGVVQKIYVRDKDVVGEGNLLMDVARPKMTTL
jgi:oxaloacetate decarboxylase alpha subunit/pyruvate carboxylase subunit B